MTELNANQFPGPLTAILAAEKIGLPVRITVGHSGFTITTENLHAFHLGAMFASDEAWDKIQDEYNEKEQEIK